MEQLHGRMFLKSTVTDTRSERMKCGHDKSEEKTSDASWMEERSEASARSGGRNSAHVMPSRRQRSRPTRRKRLWRASVNPYINFLRDYRERHKRLRVPTVARRAARAWLRMGARHRHKYVHLAWRTRRKWLKHRQIG